MTVYLRRNFGAPNVAEVDRWRENNAHRASSSRPALPDDSLTHERMAFVTFSYVRDDNPTRLFEFLLPAVDTWAAPTSATSNRTSSSPLLPSLYVVLSESSREPFERYCGGRVEGDLSSAQRLSSLCSRLGPVYVDCPEGKYGESPCCKQQEGLLALFDRDEYPRYDWYVFFDDDAYLRKEYIGKILAAMLPGSPDDLMPMAAIPYNQDRMVVGLVGRHCDREYTYPWGMPIFYSRGAVEMMAPGYRAKSLVSQCAAFNVTHDVGNAMLNWMYGLVVARLPPFMPLPDFREDYIGSHWAGREDMRVQQFGEDRRIEKGPRRGQLVRALPEGQFSFHETHKRWTSIASRAPPVYKLRMVNDATYRWYSEVGGFERTRAYALHGDPQSWGEGTWHTMNVSGCNSKAAGLRK